MSLERKETRNGKRSFKDAGQSKKYQRAHSWRTGGIGNANARKADLHKGSRNNGICDIGRRLGRDCHPGDNCLQAKAGRALASDSNWDIGIVGRTGCITPCPKAGRRRHLRNDRLNRFLERHGIGKDRRRNATDHFRNVLRGISQDEKGQSTVEYAVIVGASLAIVVALGLLAEALNDGMFVQHAISAASHNMQVIIGGAADVFSF